MKWTDKEVKVYGLYSTEDFSRIRYIGQTVNTVEERLKRHIKSALKGGPYRTHLHNWIKDAYARGFKIEVCILKAHAVWNEDEILMIKEYRARGFNLTNCTDGGQGCLNPGIETRQKLSESSKNIRKNMSEEQLTSYFNNLSLSQRKKWDNASDEQREKWANANRESHKKENLSDEARKNYSNGHLRENLSQETLLKHSKSSKETWVNMDLTKYEETVSKMSISQKERYKKMSESERVDFSIKNSKSKKAMWLNRSLEWRLEFSKKQSETMKKYYAEKVGIKQVEQTKFGVT